MADESKPVTPFDLFKARVLHIAPLVAVEISDKRMSICNGCPELRTKTNFRGVKDTCKQCGCFMPEKTKLPGAFCPLDPPKWGTAEAVA